MNFWIVFQHLGCDNRLLSKIRYDACGVCGGNGSSCNIIEGEFTQMSGKGTISILFMVFSRSHTSHRCAIRF